jgi:serine/threonine protein phosphatase PrpC
VANVGDSSAALVSLTNDGDVAAQLLTVDHNGMDEQEAARIRSQYSGVAWWVFVATRLGGKQAAFDTSL